MIFTKEIYNGGWCVKCKSKKEMTAFCALLKEWGDKRSWASCLYGGITYVYKEKKKVVDYSGYLIYVPKGLKRWNASDFLTETQQEAYSIY